jgi:hypothetical protein
MVFIIVGLPASTHNQCYDIADCHRWQPRDTFAGSSWSKTVDGVFNLNDDYYAKSGGILTPSPHYEAMFNPN